LSSDQFAFYSNGFSCASGVLRPRLSKMHPVRRNGAKNPKIHLRLTMRHFAVAFLQRAQEFLIKALAQY
jgi:hypothetical protein